MQFDICCSWTLKEKSNLGLEHVQVEEIVGEFTENVFVKLNFLNLNSCLYLCLATEFWETIIENHVFCRS